jgi:hypothetical protein
MSFSLSLVGGAAAQFFDDNGVILSGGKIYTYSAGTTTPRATYTSSSGSTPHSNPIILNAAGRVPGGEIWLDAGILYKFIIKTSADVLLGTYDNVVGAGANLTAADIVYTPAGNTAVPTTVQNKLREYVSVKDFGAKGDGITDDTIAFQNAITYAGQQILLSAGMNKFIEHATVYVPSGTYIISSTIQLYYGVVLQGDGPQSTILKHQGGFVNCIEAGRYIVLSGVTSGFGRAGGVKNLSIYGLPDTSYNASTVAGRINKTNQTVYGIKLDGAFGSFLIEDVDIYFCQSGLWADRSYFLNAQRLRIFYSSGHGAQVYGSNLFKFIACDFQLSGGAGFFLDRQDVGTGEITKSSLLQSCDFESNAFQGAYITNYNMLEIDSCYFEINMLYNTLYPNTPNQELFVDGSAGFNRVLTIQNSLFNALNSADTAIDVVYFKRGDKITCTGNSFVCAAAYKSLIRFGANTSNILWLNNQTFGPSPSAIYDLGCNAYVNNGDNTLPFKNLIVNGQLQSWQNATSATVTSGATCPTADNWYVTQFDVGSTTSERRSFSAIQTDVPGYPLYYMRLTQTGNSLEWGLQFRVAPTQFLSILTPVAFGFWARTDATKTITVGLSRIQISGTTLSYPSINVQLSTSWQFIPYSAVLTQNLTVDPQNIDDHIQIRVVMSDGVTPTTGWVEIANAQAEISTIPTSIAKITDAANLALCQQVFVRAPSPAIVFSGNVTSGSTYQVNVDFPVPMRKPPTVAINTVTETNLAGAVTISDVTTAGFRVSIVATGTGAGNWVAGYTANAYY